MLKTFAFCSVLVVLVLLVIVLVGEHNSDHGSIIEPGDTAHLPDHRWTFNLNPECYRTPVHLRLGGTVTILGELEEDTFLAKYEWPDDFLPLIEDGECREILISLYENEFRRMEGRYQATLAEIQEQEELRKKIVKMLEEN